MPRPTRLEEPAVDRALAACPAWTRSEDGKRIRRTFEFGDFIAAFGFMTRCALEAQTLGHHPDWKNVYNRVEVELWTHDVGGLTELDFELARRMDRHATVDG